MMVSRIWVLLADSSSCRTSLERPGNCLTILPEIASCESSISTGRGGAAWCRLLAGLVRPRSAIWFLAGSNLFQVALFLYSECKCRQALTYLCLQLLVCYLFSLSCVFCSCLNHLKFYRQKTLPPLCFQPMSCRCALFGIHMCIICNFPL